jgi:hypothetical protein
MSGLVMSVAAYDPQGYPYRSKPYAHEHGAMVAGCPASRASVQATV